MEKGKGVVMDVDTSDVALETFEGITAAQDVVKVVKGDKTGGERKDKQ